MSDGDPEDGRRGPDPEGDAPEPEDDPTAAELDEPLASDTLPAAVPCPFCDSTDTKQFAVFGGQASTSQYYCNGCRTVFEYLRWR